MKLAALDEAAESEEESEQPEPPKRKPRQSTARSKTEVATRDPLPTYAAPPVPMAPTRPMNLPSLEAFIRQADAHYAQGWELANRGAYFSARAEFVESLRRVVQGLDAATGSNGHSQALAAAMLALKEADDFLPRGSKLDSDFDVTSILNAHRTPVLKGMPAAGLTPAVIVEQYYAYAGEQFSRAVGSVPSGSRALHALGKIYGILATQKTPALSSAENHASVFHQAALRSDPANYMAANDLAVLLANQGRYQDARDLLVQGLGASAQPAMWQNLAMVHGQLGETHAANQAQRAAAAYSGGAYVPPTPALAAWQSMRWVDPATFAGTSQAPPELQRAAPVANPGAKPGAVDPNGPKSRTAIRRTPWSNFLQ